MRMIDEWSVSGLSVSPPKRQGPTHGLLYVQNGLNGASSFAHVIKAHHQLLAESYPSI